LWGLFDDDWATWEVAHDDDDWATWEVAHDLGQDWVRGYDAMLRLVELGLAEAFSIGEGDERRGPIPLEQARETLSSRDNWRSWNEAPREIVYRFEPTPAGSTLAEELGNPG
jgi:hypothetical protein